MHGSSVTLFPRPLHLRIWLLLTYFYTRSPHSQALVDLMARSNGFRERKEGDLAMRERYEIR